jgi:hypothetical protein
VIKHWRGEDWTDVRIIEETFMGVDDWMLEGKQV